MKGGKDGPEKYYFFLPNNRSIQVSAQYSITCGNQRWQEVKTTRWPGNKHDMQIEKWKVRVKNFI